MVTINIESIFLTIFLHHLSPSNIEDVVNCNFENQRDCNLTAPTTEHSSVNLLFGRQGFSSLTLRQPSD